MKYFFGLLCILVLLGNYTPSAHALKKVNGDYASFSHHIKRYHSAALEHCRDNAHVLLNQGEIYGSLEDPETLRHACGRWMQGSTLEEGTSVFFDHAENDSGRMDALGYKVELRNDELGKDFILFIGWTTRTTQRQDEEDKAFNYI